MRIRTAVFTRQRTRFSKQAAQSIVPLKIPPQNDQTQLSIHKQNAKNENCETVRNRQLTKLQSENV